MRRISCVLTLALMAAGSVPVLMAQAPQAQRYVVQPGDTLWRLSGDYLGDPVKWGEVLGANPFLKEPGRQFSLPDGRIVVLIRPGERLNGIANLGVTAEPVPISELKPVVPAPMLAPVILNSGTDWIRGLLLLVGFLLVMTILYYLFVHRRKRELAEQTAQRERELVQNPITSGPPIVAGGIPSTDTARLTNHFQDRAVAQYVAQNPGADATAIGPRIERIGPIEEGMISGEGLVGYADRARPRRIDPPQPGYRARFRFPDGREELMMSLQGCMNPVFYGEGLSGFTFTPGRIAVPAPEPPQPAPQAAPHPAMAVRAIRTAAEGEGRSTLTIGDRVMTFERGVHLTVDEATGYVGVSGGSFDMTIKPKRRQRRLAVATDRQTGTE